MSVSFCVQDGSTRLPRLLSFQADQAVSIVNTQISFCGFLFMRTSYCVKNGSTAYGNTV